jgi:hypothetical protein
VHPTCQQPLQLLLLLPLLLRLLSPGDPQGRQAVLLHRPAHLQRLAEPPAAGHLT